MNCYSCEAKLTKDNKSIEHIIPNFLGGHIKSNNLLCKECNINLGTKVDAELSKQAFLAYLIGFKLDRGKQKNKKIKVKVGRSDKEVLISKNGEWSRIKPDIEFEDGKFKALKTDNYKSAKKILTKLKIKDPTIDVDKILSNAEFSEEFLEEKIYFEEKTMGGVLLQKAISKIALNYYKFNFPDAKNYHDLRDYICGINKKREFSTFYYSLFDNIYVPKKDEISHLVYLKGDNRKRLLYCYIELFNTHNFIVMIDDCYSGPPITKKYGYDLISGSEIDDLDLDFYLIENLFTIIKYQYWFEKYMRDVTELHNKRFDALLEKIDKLFHVGIKE